MTEDKTVETGQAQAEEPSAGFLIFLADWMRFPKFRTQLLDANVNWDKVADQLRKQYLLTDCQLGILAQQLGDRDALASEVSRLLRKLPLDKPANWEGAQPPPSGPDDRPGPGWPGNAVICIESLKQSVAGAVRVNTEVSFEVVGWNFPWGKSVAFQNFDGDLVVGTGDGLSDECGRFKGTVKVTFNKAGEWFAFPEEQVAGSKNLFSSAIDVKEAE